jgi:SAM-dependent methyltransferase
MTAARNENSRLIIREVVTIVKVILLIGSRWVNPPAEIRSPLKRAGSRSMNRIRHLSFAFWYLRRPPWDSGIVPPEVVEFIRDTPPGRALDLGCGTGTSSLALASAGWRVTGVDFVPRAIAIAKRKARNKNLAVDFLVADVNRLPDSLFSTLYDLILDIGCFHGLSPSDKHTYLAQLPSLLAAGGTWLLYGFFKPEVSAGPGLVTADIEQAQRVLELVKRQDGVDRKGRASAWLWFGRREE